MQFLKKKNFTWLFIIELVYYIEIKEMKILYDTQKYTQIVNRLQMKKIKHLSFF